MRWVRGGGRSTLRGALGEGRREEVRWVRGGGRHALPRTGVGALGEGRRGGGERGSGGAALGVVCVWCGGRSGLEGEWVWG